MIFISDLTGPLEAFRETLRLKASSLLFAPVVEESASALVEPMGRLGNLSVDGMPDWTRDALAWSTALPVGALSARLRWTIPLRVGTAPSTR